jgi:L-lactate dehydrogenase complex protein LldG
MSPLGSNREQFLARVRQAAEAGRSYRVPTRDVADATGYVGAETDLCLALSREISEVGGRAIIVDGWAQASITLAQMLRSFEPRTAIRWRYELLDRVGLDSMLQQMRVGVHDVDSLLQLPPDEQRAVILAADVGITSTTLAIAETGSLLLAARPGQERVVSLLPPIHLAIVAQSQIVPDLFDAMACVRQCELPSALTLVTGPSKTGDIELQLTTGVHGPGKWHVLIVRESAGS